MKLDALHIAAYVETLTIWIAIFLPDVHNLTRISGNKREGKIK